MDYRGLTHRELMRRVTTRRRVLVGRSDESARVHGKAWLKRQIRKDLVELPDAAAYSIKCRLHLHSNLSKSFIECWGIRE